VVRLCNLVMVVVARLDLVSFGLVVVARCYGLAMGGRLKLDSFDQVVAAGLCKVMMMVILCKLAMVAVLSLAVLKQAVVVRRCKLVMVARLCGLKVQAVAVAELKLGRWMAARLGLVGFELAGVIM